MFGAGHRTAAAARSSSPAPGWPAARLRSSRAPASATRCASAAGSSTLGARREAPSGDPPAKSPQAYDAWSCPATAPTREHAAPVEGRGAGAHRPARLQHAATTRAPPASRTSSRTSPGCCTRTTARRPAASCACARSTSSPRRRIAGHRRPPPAKSTATLKNLADKVAIHLNDTAPGDRRRRADAGARATSRAWPWADGLGHHAAGLRLHQPHADARGARDLAGRR